MKINKFIIVLLALNIFIAIFSMGFHNTHSIWESNMASVISKTVQSKNEEILHSWIDENIERTSNRFVYFGGLSCLISAMALGLYRAQFKKES